MQPPGFRAHRLLLVDPDLGTHAAYRAALGPGLAITSAFTTEEAVRALQRDAPDTAVVCHGERHGEERVDSAPILVAAREAEAPVPVIVGALPVSRLLRLRGVGTQSPRHGAGSRSASTYVDRAVALTASGFARASVGRMAHALAVSSRQLRRALHQELGCTPAAYLTRVRVEAGALLLRRTSAPIEEIAATVGFADASHFSRCFRRWLGCRPGQYRRATLTASGTAPAPRHPNGSAARRRALDRAR